MKVEPNQELKGLVCNGANVLPTRVVHNAFRSEFGMSSSSSIGLFHSSTSSVSLVIWGMAHASVTYGSC